MSGAPETLEGTLQRLKREREEADRRYNDALTGLDRALRPPVAVPDPAPGFDDRRLPEINDAWQILPAPPAAGGLKGRLVGLIWRTVAPYLQRQLTFNSILVDHANRSAEAQRAAYDRQAQLAAAIRAQFDQLSVLQAQLMQLLQQVTAYVDTKDRDSAGGLLVLNAALSELAESQAKHYESLAAREHRHLARTAAIEDLRMAMGVAQQAIVALKRHVEQHPHGSPVHPHGATGRTAFSPSLDAYKYVGFEDQFRGSQAVIRERLESYVAQFDRPDAPGGDVLDVGCGRGEFLDLLKGRGIGARGIDLNHEMAEVCRARGLSVVQADAVGYLAAQDDASLGGIFAAQVVEHLDPPYLLKFLELSFVKLQPGGRLVLETLNPACWTAFFESYIRDITHKWPLHPDTLKYLATASGFCRVEIEFRSPVASQDRLQPVVVPAGVDGALGDIAETFNANVEKLNARMFTHMDYALLAEKGARP